MSEKSAFNPNQLEEKLYVEPKGVLDQLNLPAGVVKFIRKNKTILQITTIVVVTAVVTGSLYDSYRVKRMEDSASSFAISMEATGENKVKALQQVVADYSGTSSALWASTELAHMAMKDGKYKEAGSYYTEVRDKISQANPMFGLLTFGIAQSEEADKNYSSAFVTYSTLKGIEGYEDEGYLGMARVLEAQGENQKALAIYEEYMGSFLGEEKNERLTRMIQEKITRLRVEK
ncbi:tetratricopeptide repeat protein [Desulfocapsa sp. AH-315-G09]|nr:tetratricopeptide repeat protein [Desulfocapsa sp.]MBN4048567.1 tetratricopeptide repeat protein [bacterium AH-315-N22]MBN4058714.1 tetratricopeptide repeat protein [Desulfocapsa sp. AH-315-J15]MBN4065187.1 tetratricopeptide repeat protein [Desulfocapsa sp. AH-315-G09]